jgi:hypothetical protein
VEGVAKEKKITLHEGGPTEKVVYIFCHMTDSAGTPFHYDPMIILDTQMKVCMLIYMFQL